MMIMNSYCVFYFALWMMMRILDAYGLHTGSIWGYFMGRDDSWV